MIKRVKVGGSLTFQKLAYQYHYIKAVSTLIWVEPRVILLTLYIYIDELLTRPKIIISIILYLFIVLGRFY